MLARHLRPRTVQAYVGWIVRHMRYHGTRHPGEMGERVVVACLTSRREDPDIARRVIGVRRGTGDKDRVTMLPECARMGVDVFLERTRVACTRRCKGRCSEQSMRRESRNVRPATRSGTHTRRTHWRWVRNPDVG